MKKQITALSEVQKPNKFKTIVLKIGKRNLIIACSVLLIGAAVWLNWILFSGGTGAEEGYGGYDQPSGIVSDSNTPNTENENSVNTYFSATQVSRQRARDEAIEVLQAVVDSKDSNDTAKSEALAEIAEISEQIRLESNIESLILAKGFEQCVAVLNGDSASIVVQADSLQAAQIAQINAIVYEQTGIEPSGVTIISKS